MNTKDSPLFLINSIKEHTGLTGRQIRYYEAKGIICPSRTSGNQRVFSLSDLEILQKVVAYLNQGMTLDTIRRKLKKEEEQYYRKKIPEPSVNEGKPSPVISSLYPVNSVKSLTELIINIRKSDES